MSHCHSLAKPRHEAVRVSVYSINIYNLISSSSSSSSTAHHTRSHHPSLLHSFTPGSKPAFSTNPFHRRFLLPTGLPHDNGTGPDLSCSSFFLVLHFNFLFVPCSRLSWLPVSFLLHIEHTLSYRIVSHSGDRLANKPKRPSLEISELNAYSTLCCWHWLFTSTGVKNLLLNYPE